MKNSYKTTQDVFSGANDLKRVTEKRIAGFVAQKCKLSELFLSKMILLCTWTHRLVCLFVFKLWKNWMGMWWGFLQEEGSQKETLCRWERKYILIDRFFCSSLVWILISVYIPAFHFTLALIHFILRCL